MARNHKETVDKDLASLQHVAATLLHWEAPWMARNHKETVDKDLASLQHVAATLLHWESLCSERKLNPYMKKKNIVTWQVQHHNR